MKSLEHIIREIREGKAAKGDKKNLEHSIRKVVSKEYESSYGAKDSKPVEEDVGGLIGSGTGGEPKLHAEDGKKKKTDEAIGILGTDDYKGNQFKSVRTQTPHIKPPAGAGGHSQAPENVSRQRTLAKEKSSMTMHNKVTEDSLEEAKRSSTSAPSKAEIEKLNKMTTDYAEPKKDIKLGPVGEPPEVKPSTAVTTTTTKAPKITPPEGTISKVGRYASELGKIVGGRAASTLGLVLDPDFGGLLPSKGETKSEFERQKEQSAKTKTPTKPVELPPIDIKAKPQEPKPVPAPVPAPADKPKEKSLPLPVPTPPPSAAPTPPEPKGEKEKPKVAGIPTIGVPHDIDYTVSHLHRPNISRGHAKAHKKHAMKEETERKQIENMPRKGDRKSIEYVGRKSADPKTSKEKISRLATIKNVIDEAKKAMADKKIRAEDGKTKVYDYGDNVLVINPDQKRINLDVDNGDKIAKDYDNK
jgi:hypothetical protein